MANEVVVKFIGDDSNINRVADKVEDRVDQVNAKSGEIRNTLTGKVYANAEAYRAARLAEVEATAATVSSTTATVANTAATSAQSAVETELAASTAAATAAITAKAAADELSATSAALSTESMAAEALAAQFLAASVEKAQLALFGSVAVFASVVAAGAALIAISEQIRKEADLALASQEKITFGYNKEKLAIKSAADELERFIELQAKDKQFASKLATDVTTGNTSDILAQQQQAKETAKAKGEELALLQSQIERQDRILKSAQSQVPTGFANQQLNRLTGGVNTTEASKAETVNQYEKSLANLKEQAKIVSDELERSTKQITDTGAALDQVGTNYSKTASSTFQSNAESIKRQSQIFAQEVNDGIKKVLELGKTYKTVFNDLIVSSNSDNPFVSIYSAGEKSVESFREATRGLTKELRDQGEQLIKNQTSFSAFKARVDGAFEALSLRNDAEKFRTAKAKETDRQYEDRIIAGFNSARNGGYYGLNQPSDGTITTDKNGRVSIDIEKMREVAGRFAASQISSNIVGNREAVQLAAYNLYAGKEDANLTAQDRLDKQLKLADTFKASADTKDKQAAIDAKIVSVGRSIDPTTLRQDQRDKIAAALERQADRTERREEDSFKIRQEMVTLTRQIATNQKALLDKAVKEGINGIRNTLSIVDKTDGGVEVSQNPSNPTQADTQKQYEFGGFGVIGGTNK